MGNFGQNPGTTSDQGGEPQQDLADQLRAQVEALLCEINDDSKKTTEVVKVEACKKLKLLWPEDKNPDGVCMRRAVRVLLSSIEADDKPPHFYENVAEILFRICHDKGNVEYMEGGVDRLLSTMRAFTTMRTFKQRFGEP